MNRNLALVTICIWITAASHGEAHTTSTDPIGMHHMSGALLCGFGVALLALWRIGRRAFRE
ncbi:MAG: hypothetical protein O3C57_00075 [Verrucomicrobia bacterium]|nr:hypothetical protein [Verrucomicrobiota bacterium]